MFVGKPRTCIVIAYWIGEPKKDLFRLIREIRKTDAGSPFDLRIVCNGGDQKPLVLPTEFSDIQISVVNRRNVGFNIAAWNDGWKIGPAYEFYLFLQTECYLKKPGWLEAFEFRMTGDPAVGLLSEWLVWDRLSWLFIRDSTDRDLGAKAWPAGEAQHPIDTYKLLIGAAGIPIGDVGTHAPTVIHFISRKVLEEVGGYPFFGSSYREAVAVEVGFSRLIESRGYRVCMLRGSRFEYIGHRQWASPSWQKRATNNAKALLKGVGKQLGLRRTR